MDLDIYEKSINISSRIVGANGEKRITKYFYKKFIQDSIGGRNKWEVGNNKKLNENKFIQNIQTII